MSLPNPSEKNAERVIVYIDGFNLYFGMMEAGFVHCRWLNVKALAESFLKPTQQLVDTKYFTSRVSNNPDKQKRQSTYLEALYEEGVKVYYGKYQMQPIECRRCGNIWIDANEKMTDVNIATQIMVDGYCDRYDVAMLISGDSDLVPPIKAIHENFKNKTVFACFPPKRHNVSIAAVAKGSLIIGRKKLVDNQLPDEVVKTADGYILKRPAEWR